MDMILRHNARCCNLNAKDTDIKHNYICTHADAACLEHQDNLPHLPARQVALVLFVMNDPPERTAIITCY